MARNLVRVKRLGLIKYSEAYDLQQSLVERILGRRAANGVDPEPSRGQGQGPDSARHFLLLLEHTSVYTVGIRGNSYGEEEARRLRALGADFVKTDRGGLITWHGPGQLVAYPILDLKLFQPGATRATGVSWYVDLLEKALIETCESAGLAGTQAPGPPLTGVWTADLRRKVASIGVHVRDLMTYHGVALNCDPDLSWFSKIVPCGLPDAQMTSISRELGRPVTVEQTSHYLLSAFKNQFDCELVDD